MATLNPATWHGLAHLGAVAPGYQADLLLLPDLKAFVPERVLKRGRPIGEIAAVEVPEWVKHTVRVGTSPPATSRSRGTAARRA
jgi:adenine deaminase